MKLCGPESEEYEDGVGWCEYYPIPTLLALEERGDGVLFIITEKARGRERKRDGVGVMKMRFLGWVLV